ncbi:thioesterase, partial [Candidatus Magnetomorum sp. HK-1]
MDISDWKQRLKNDQFARHNGIEMIDVSTGYAHVKMDIKPFHLNGVGIVHGGAIFTLADFAFAIAANSHEQVAVAINASISFVKAVKDGTVYAEAKELSINHKLGVYKVDVFNSEKELLASFQGMAY